MIKEIKYNGYSASPSDYECADGDLAMSLNAINEDGSLRPVMQPKEIMELSNATVKCVHETGNYTHYIVVTDNNNLGWRNISGQYTSMIDFKSTEIYQITPVGNTLVVLTSDGMYYFLWKDDKYICLGNELPELNVSPYISTQMMNTTTIQETFGVSMNLDTNCCISGNDKITSPLCKELYNNNINTITLTGTTRENVYNRVFGVLNFQSHYLKQRGYFLEPFYVRFAFRMYDGSYVRQTPPVLLVPTTWGKPFMNVAITSSTAIFNPVYSASKLQALIETTDIDLWKDIITGIDVFVTEPLIDYTDNAESLLALKRYPWKTDDNAIIPKAMTAKIEDAKIVRSWDSIPSYISELNKKGFIIVPWGTITFERVKSSGIGSVTTYFIFDEGMIGYYAINNKGYTINSTNVQGQQGVAENQDLDWLDTNLSLTIFRIEDIKGKTIIFSTSEELDEDDSSITFDAYIIFGPLSDINTSYYIETKRIDGYSFNDKLINYSSFYKVAELSVNDYDTPKFIEIPIQYGVLSSLETRQTLPDLGQGHNNPIVSSSYEYNNRLNVILEKEQIKNACTSLRKQNPVINEIATYGNNIIENAYVEIYENGQRVYVEIPVDDNSMTLRDVCIFSFPNNNAKRLIVSVLDDDGSSVVKKQVLLNPHAFLNLSYAFNDFKMLDFRDFEDEILFLYNDTIEYGNIIRLSDVNNPFRFSEEYTVSLPVSNIYALSTAAKALSQGQFGQYPLYAFTSDGIWALELTSTGTYSARQPISRDVVINPDSITQLDSAVLFATQRGIMLLSGSEVTCISDILNTEDVFDITDMPKLDGLMELYNNLSLILGETPDLGGKIEPGEGERGEIGVSLIQKKDIKVQSFSDYTKDCRMLYDYPHQHLIVYNPDIRYAYVYSFKSQLWGMMLSKLRENVNSYPEALAMTNDNKLVDFSQYGTDNNNILLITRPFKMEQPDVHKTISTIIQRGNLNDRNVTQILYASNDTHNWVVVWSSNDVKMSGFRGTPYKYYRLAIVRHLNKSESLRGFTVQYEHRLTNRLR